MPATAWTPLTVGPVTEEITATARVPAATWTRVTVWTPVTLGPVTEEITATARVPATTWTLDKARAWKPVTARTSETAGTSATAGRTTIKMLKL